MPQQNNIQHDLRWLKAQLNIEINQTKIFFNTLIELVNGQFESPYEQPVSDPNINFRAFLNNVTRDQVETLEGKIINILKEFEEGCGIDA